MTRYCQLALGLAAVAFAGCSGGVTDVNGKVTYNGKPVVCGAVVLIGSDGLPKSGAIQHDGSFTVLAVKSGPVRVAVTSPRPTPPDKAGARQRVGREAGDSEKLPPPSAQAVSPEVAKNWVELPEKFGDPDKFGLTLEVVPGKPLEIDLK